MEQQRIGIIIVAGGSGSRIGGTIPKQFRLLGGEPVLGRIINTFARASAGATIVVALPQQHLDFWKNMSARFDIAPHTAIEGGTERFHSVANGLAALPEDIEIIAIHDGARPFCSEELIRRALRHGAEHHAAIPVVPVSDSFRQVSDNGDSAIIDRRTLKSVQTPQVFDALLLRKAYEIGYDPLFTDDASVVEKAGIPIALLEGESSNIKLTSPEDFAVAEALLEYLNPSENGCE